MRDPGVVVAAVVALIVACGDSPARRPVPDGTEATPAQVVRSTAAGAVGSTGLAGSESPDGGTADRFAEAVAASFQATRRDDGEPYRLSEGGPVPVAIEAWSFVEQGAALPEAGVRLQFSLRIFEFGSVDASTEALADLAATAEESILLKAPLLAVRSGSSVVRLDGACSFSRERWVAIQDALIGALPPDSRASSSEALEILCGGAVVRTPGSGTPGSRGRDEPSHDGVEQ